ncbi:hypothetical protein [Cellulomonas endophytica]|uniref:hypothetical protein n=1 Tax=Cellulomonas endophytica TaxID=2494735 RepID=UPI0010102318|nr:hypothetical protein [Cellulomonas endophytica]
MRADHVLSHTSAALLWGLPVWTSTPLVVHVRQRHAPGSGRDRGVVRHRGGWDTTRTAVVAGLPVTDLAQTVADCLSGLAAGPALVVADAALRAGADRAAVDEILAGQRSGRTRGAAVLALADPGAESAGESMTRFALLRGGLPAPVTQPSVGTRLGTFWADLGWPEHRVLLEYDGRSKYAVAGGEAVVREKRREDAVLDEDQRLVRVAAEDLRRPAELVARVRRLLPADLPHVPRPHLSSAAGRRGRR